MYKTETLIVIENINQFNKFNSKWRVECNPNFNNGNYFLPLGWESELTENNIRFEVKEIELEINEEL